MREKCRGVILPGSEASWCKSTRKNPLLATLEIRSKKEERISCVANFLTCTGYINYPFARAAFEERKSRSKNTGRLY
jgi:hypothetical protein